MHAYLDSSVLLRKIFNEPNKLSNLGNYESFISSTLLEVECFRTIHRARQLTRLSESEGVSKSQEIYQYLQLINQIRITDQIIQIAKRPFAVALGSLDAIHLASALLWKERKAVPLVMLTHDERLAAGARTEGIHVIGA